MQRSHHGQCRYGAAGHVWAPAGRCRIIGVDGTRSAAAEGTGSPIRSYALRMASVTEITPHCASQLTEKPMRHVPAAAPFGGRILAPASPDGNAAAGAGQACYELDPLALLAAGYSGVRVIAGVHGASDAFHKAVDDALRDGRYLIQLGDIIDRGIYSPFCVELMLDPEARGAGKMVMGNHEYKFARFCDEGRYAAPSRIATLGQFEQYEPALLRRFLQRLTDVPLWIRMDNWLFGHAAFDPCMMRPPATEVPEAVRGVALFGTRATRRRSSMHATPPWVNSIPPQLTVVVGHTITPDGQIEYHRENAEAGRSTWRPRVGGHRAGRWIRWISPSTWQLRRRHGHGPAPAVA